jgi:MFS family permease
MPLRPGARAWAVWSVALAAYTVGVLHRTSLGVAGLHAQHRFGINAGTLALFAVMQLMVYAGLQVPVGLLLDRFGSLRLVVSGAVVMASGQALMAFADGVPGAAVPGRGGRAGRHPAYSPAGAAAAARRGGHRRAPLREAVLERITTR